MIESGFGPMKYSPSKIELICSCRNDIVLLKMILKRIYHLNGYVNRRFIEALSSKLMEIDPTIPPLPLKDIVSPRGL